MEPAVRGMPVAIGVALALYTGTAPATGCAATPGDPFEKFNRQQFRIEERFTKYTIGPLTHLYRALTPGVIGKAIHNIIYNMKEPEAFINDLLQLRPKRAGVTAVRFVLNSTIGVGGMIDVAAKAGLPFHPSSFGDTLGRYGVHPGPFLFLPMVGPSTVRDLVGNIVDDVLNPLHFVHYPHRQTVSVSLAVAGGIDKFRQSEEGLRALLSNATDPYATLRSTYLQDREAEVSGQTAIPETLPSLDAPDPEPSAPANSQPQATSPSGAGQPSAPPQDNDPPRAANDDDQEDCIGALIYAQAHGHIGGALAHPADQRVHAEELTDGSLGASSCPVARVAERAPSPTTWEAPAS